MRAVTVFVVWAWWGGAMAQQGGGGEPSNPGWIEARVAAVEVRERLVREVEAMKRVRAAQEVLMNWNAERAAVGSTARTLDPALCEEEEVRRWCAQLPATFGLQGEGR